MFLLAQLAGAPAATAQEPEIVERIVAVVDEEPILLSELQAQLMLAANAYGVDPADSVKMRQLRREVLEQQIDQRVLYLTAQKENIPVDEQEIDQLIEDAITRNREESGSEEVFQLQLRREGLTEQDLRQRYREQARLELMVSRLIQREVREEVAVTPQDVRAYFEEHRDELPQREAGIHLQRIVIQVKPDPGLYENARELAENVRTRIESGSVTFADAARRYSDDPNGREGGDLRRVRRGDFVERLGPAFEDSLFALEPETLSRPLRSPLGFHLVQVREKDPAGEWVRASHILFGVPIVQADHARAEELAQELHERLMAGESFEELARRYSDDPRSGDEGGDLGWLPIAALGETLRGPVEALEVGETSRPVVGRGEVQIFRLLGREAERDFTYEEIEQELAELVRNSRMEKRYRDWVDGLKLEHYIERRGWDED